MAAGGPCECCSGNSRVIEPRQDGFHDRPSSDDLAGLDDRSVGLGPLAGPKPAGDNAAEGCGEGDRPADQARGRQFRVGQATTMLAFDFCQGATRRCTIEWR